MDVPPIPLPPEVGHHLYLAVKESLRNVVKHAGATEVWVRLQLTEETVTLVIEDNGRGFEIDGKVAAGADGLDNLNRRLVAIGGRCECRSADVKDVYGGGAPMTSSIARKVAQSFKRVTSSAKPQIHSILLPSRFPPRRSLPVRFRVQQGNQSHSDKEMIVANNYADFALCAHETVGSPFVPMLDSPKCPSANFVGNADSLPDGLTSSNKIPASALPPAASRVLQLRRRMDFSFLRSSM
jgi:Histidine kinase-, DNA gyrase B-, and HSP90-like ATPase